MCPPLRGENRTAESGAGHYFRLLLIGYFQGIDSAGWRVGRRIRWRRAYLSELDRCWKEKPEAQQAVYGNRRRIRGEHGKELLRRRGELLERSFAHAYETGGLRRVHLRGRDNVLKRMLIHVGGFNLSLVMRKLLGKGTPRGLQGLSAENLLLLLRFWVAVLAGAVEESASTPMFMSSHALPSRFLLCSRQNERISSATGC